jgi:predicted Rossmann fold nucleotide-binding protein DprA/Smf involved in DNA uptake
MKRVGVTGHQNIPLVAVDPVRTEIERILSTAGDIVGLSSLAAGADQVFARAVLNTGGRLHAIIPCARYESTFTDENTLDSFRELLDAASEIETLPHDRPSQQAFLEAGHRVVELAELVIAVWDGKEAQGTGGTAEIVHYARERGREVVIVWPAGTSR